MWLPKLTILSCFILINASLCYSFNSFSHSIDSIAIPDTIISADSTTYPLIAPEVDSIKIDSSFIVLNDTAQLSLIDKEPFKPNPTKAVIYAAAFPGLGQVYNRKYWKLPIVYGGFLGFSYAISWNGRYYTDYAKGYKDIMNDDPEADSWKNFLPYGQDPDSVDKEWLKDVLKRRKDYYRRYRDLSIIGTVAMYALSILDAYVDAQLFDFDISSDLTLRVEPTLIKKTDYLANSVGFQCSISF